MKELEEVSVFRFEDEPDGFLQRRKKALELTGELEMPSSIRTPGRTWTRYPEPVISEFEAVEPDIRAGGDAEIFTGAEAVEQAGEKLLDALKPGENRLTALHTVLLNAVVYVEVDGRADIEIVYDEDSPVFSHLVVETRESAELEISERFYGDQGFGTSFSEFYLGANSKVDYGVLESRETELSYSREKALVGRDASINWLNGQFGSGLSRSRMETVLKGDGAETEKTGVWYPVDDHHTDISMHVYHVGDGTRCSMDSRAVVDDSARSVYEGLQKVEPGAEETQSFQNEKTLVLSDSAEADASPKLMIEHPDVKASHAASAGGIPDDELHYMESRGIDEGRARRLVVSGFFEPVMGTGLESLKNHLREEVNKKLSR